MQEFREGHPPNVEQREDETSASAFEVVEYPKDGVERFEKQIEDIITNPDKYIDQGGAGKVYNLVSGRCIKVLESRENAPDPGNSMELECRFQEQLSGINISGARAPECYGYWETGNPKRMVILMEQLDAVNLQHVLNKTEPLPENFDQDKFMDVLQEYFEYMHNEKQIVHGDIAPRNVMVDRKTGLPRVIDFGRTKVIGHMTEESRKRFIEADEHEFNNIDDQLDALMNSK